MNSALDAEIEDCQDGANADDAPEGYGSDEGLDTYLLYYFETQTGSNGEEDRYQALLGNVDEYIIKRSERVGAYICIEYHGKHEKENKPGDGYF